MRKGKIDVVTLGCSKNLVDSEKLMRQLEVQGYTVEHDPKQIDGEIVIVNTCGFIGDAQEESVNMILELGELKKRNKIKKLFVIGCLAERFKHDLVRELPEVDQFYGKFDWPELLPELGKTYNTSIATERTLTTPAHYAYLKISEGCNRGCSFCAIPIMTGKHRSVDMEAIELEVKQLVSKGVKEFQLIAQDLTFYGQDLYKRQALPELIERLSDIPGVEWLRLHYGYPAQFPYDLLRVMRERPNVCKYMDIALQHISDTMLKRMRRIITKQETFDLIARFREEVPGIHLRTTLMVGFPGETEDDFNELLEFVERERFERLGAFAYSHEAGTYAYKNYRDDVPFELKEARLEQLMGRQQKIAEAINERKVGQVLKAIIDREEGDYYIGRTEFDSPEVDPEVLIQRTEPLQIGQFYNIKINGTDYLDLTGSVLNL